MFYAGKIEFHAGRRKEFAGRAPILAGKEFFMKWVAGKDHPTLGF